MCILRGQVGVVEGKWVQVSNYVCEGWVGECGGGVEVQLDSKVTGEILLLLLLSLLLFEGKWLRPT